ncbi:probable disease resistance protein At5g63020 [Cornus florida]|uniref:probable disease resistance protein At5g63020 n=1 Tax=Cornus florida TaxID=4283 RepID=UPI0028981594|nr:probable disease resistance protein At5g63020 [Cornus florida]
MDFVSPILDATCRLCGCIRDTTYYIRYLQDNLNSLTTEMETLKGQRDDVKTQVEAAERLPMQQRTKQVDGWLQRVQQLEREVEELLQQGDEQIQHKCLKICPRNCWSTHKLGKRVSEKLQTVSNMKSEGNFSTVAVPMAAEHAEETPLDRTVGLDANFHKLSSLLREDGTEIIGICGMGGVGKTTLLKKINNELAIQSRSEFDEVIWVTVSKDLSTVESIQDKIGTKLRFSDEKWRGKSQEEKKADIFKVLKRKKFVLLLDDIWKRIDLLEVGVPVPDSQNKAKIIFTTRFEDVCGLMQAKKNIKAECLAWEEAWDLFKEKVGEEMINSDSEIATLAKEVCKECAGLPLALCTIGRAMASKRTPQEWDYAVSVLKKSIFKFSDMGDQVFPLLKFSYDNLPDETIKTCFLYCALVPEDYNIDVFDLIKLWIGEGFLDAECDDNIDDARKLAYDIICRLKLACLLVESSDSNHVNMHDLIRDMALWIVWEKGIVWESGSGESHKLISKWEKTERVFLSGISIEKLSESTPRCPNLLTLILCDNNDLRTISNSFFQFMPALKVLDLAGNSNLRKLPTSLLGLVSLQYLDLSGTGIRELSIEFKSLVKLKYLYLNNMWQLDTIPPQVMSSLLSLQRLEMRGSGVSSKGNIDEGNSFLFDGKELLWDELECLNHLQYLSLTVKTEIALQKLLSSQKLSSFTFGLCITQFKGSSSLRMSSLQKKMEKLEILEIERCNDIEELTMGGMRWEERERGALPHKNHHHPLQKSITDGSRSFHNLREVGIFNCNVLKEVTWLIWVPNLETLDIGSCDAMEKVIKDAEEDCSSDEDEIIGGELSAFARLQTLTLLYLPELKSIYSHPLPFPSLTKIEVLGCPKLNKLPLDCNSSGKGRLREIGCEGEWRDKLEWENEETRSAFFPLFKCPQEEVDVS